MSSLRERMKLIAVTFFRYEPSFLVADWMENVEWIREDGLGETIAIDTSDHDAPWIPKAERRRAMTNLARGSGADFLLELDADERLEDNARKVIPELLADPKEPYPHFRFPLREMWTPTEYRVDGWWGKKRRGRLRPVRNGSGRGIHAPLNIYHLTHIERESRQARRDTHRVHNRWDNGGRFDYLLNEKGLKLEAIPEGRGFSPPYTKPYIRKAIT